MTIYWLGDADLPPLPDKVRHIRRATLDRLGAFVYQQTRAFELQRPKLTAAQQAAINRHLEHIGTAVYEMQQVADAEEWQRFSDWRPERLLEHVLTGRHQQHEAAEAGSRPSAAE